MISREVWHIEATSFEQEMRRLMEEGHRGIISPQEFMSRMLRLHGYEGNTESLLRREGDQWIITHAWRQAHRDIIGPIEEATLALERIFQESVYRSGPPDWNFVDYLVRVRGFWAEDYEESARSLIQQLLEVCREGNPLYLWEMNLEMDLPPEEREDLDVSRLSRLPETEEEALQYMKLLRDDVINLLRELKARNPQ